MKIYVNYLDSLVGVLGDFEIAVMNNMVELTNSENAVKIIIKSKDEVVLYLISIYDGDEFVEGRAAMDKSTFYDELKELTRYKLRTEEKEKWKSLRDEVVKIYKELGDL